MSVGSQYINNTTNNNNVNNITCFAQFKISSLLVNSISDIFVSKLHFLNSCMNCTEINFTDNNKSLFKKKIKNNLPPYIQ